MAQPVCGSSQTVTLIDMGSDAGGVRAAVPGNFNNQVGEILRSVCRCQWCHDQIALGRMILGNDRQACGLGFQIDHAYAFPDTGPDKQIGV